MRKALMLIAAVGALLALTAARPASELQLFTQLNGQPVRWRLPDGGSSGLYAASGLAYASLDGGLLNGQAFQPNVVMFVPETPTNICIRPSVDNNGRRMAWDGGCNMTEGDENFGVGLQPYVPFYFVPHPNATTIVGVSDAGLVRGALYQMQ